MFVIFNRHFIHLSMKKQPLLEKRWLKFLNKEAHMDDDNCGSTGSDRHKRNYRLDSQLTSAVLPSAVPF